jgi:hypothetical protein
MSINQAVIFTKPVHHLGLDLTPEKLDALVREYFEAAGFTFILQREVTGSVLAARDVIKQHYLMYSQASCADAFEIAAAGREKFSAAFGKSWDEEVAAGRIISTAQLLEGKGIDVHQLFTLWNEEFVNRRTQKLQDGMIMAYLADLDAYCVNAFFPAMEANFNDPATRISYYVVEFDPAEISWEIFRKEILGSTDASRAVPDSFRGKLYAEYKVDYPGRDNFVHGSAGPFEGFVERAIHETGFNACDNPIGRYLAERDIGLEEFAAWKAAQSITDIGNLFDETEEKNTADILPILDATAF